jgi:outer membrane lipoprotein-sorting protein
MSDTDQGRARLAVVIALVVVSAGVVAASGFVFADDQRSGEEILEDVQEKYKTADSVSADTAVTVDAAEETTQFDAAIAGAGEDKLRLNVSDEGEYVLMGTDGESVWVHDPATELTGVLTSAGDGEATLAVLAGTEESTGGISAFLPEEFDEETTVGELLGEVDDNELSAEWREQIESVPEDTTISELTTGEGLENVSTEEIDLPDDVDESELPDEFESPAEWNKSSASALFDESDLTDDIDESDLEKFEEVELPEEWEDKTLAEKWDETELPEEWENSERAQEIDEFTQEYDSIEEFRNEYNTSDPALQVELVGTTTVDGQEANELRITHPDTDGETHLYTGVESDVILKQETVTPDATVTVDVLETQFDVSPADSTFEPPGTTELASADLAWTESADEFAQDVTLGVAEPGEAWTFEYGGTVTTQADTIPGIGAEFDGATVTQGATYVDGDRSLFVAQSNQTVDVTEYAETETIRGQDVALEVTEEGAVATWTEAGATNTVGGDLSESQLRTVLEAIEFE